MVCGHIRSQYGGDYLGSHLLSEETTPPAAVIAAYKKLTSEKANTGESAARLLHHRVNKTKDNWNMGLPWSFESTFVMARLGSQLTGLTLTNRTQI